MTSTMFPHPPHLYTSSRCVIGASLHFHVGQRLQMILFLCNERVNGSLFPLGDPLFHFLKERYGILFKPYGKIKGLGVILRAGCHTRTGSVLYKNVFTREIL